MNLFLFLLINHFHRYFSFNSSGNILSQGYTPLYYFTSKTLMITNPCHTDQSILIRNHSLYKFDREQSQRKRICVWEKLFSTQTSIVNSIAHLNNDLILIINGNLFRTQDIISSSTDNDIIYRLLRYSNVPILSDRIDYVFTTPCCTCLQTNIYRSISHTFNEYVILGKQSGNVIIFNLKSTTIVYDFKNIFQFQSICQSNSCSIQYLGLIHSQPILICLLQYQLGKSILFHQPFFEFTSSNQKSTLINFTGDTLHMTPSVIPNAYFIWDEKKLYYTSNGGLILSEIIPNGCEIDSIDENQLKTYYTNLNIDYDNITLLTKEIYCLNITIDYIFISNYEFFISTKTSSAVQWLYGQESFFPSMISLPSGCIRNQSMPSIDSQCLFNMNNQSVSCSPSVQSYCSYIRFEPLFDIKQIYVVEKMKENIWKFVLESYRIIPIMMTSTKSSFFNYSISYEINRLNHGIIQTIGSILVSTTNQMNDDRLGSSMISLRLGLLQYGYACPQTASFSFQIEASCSPTSALRVLKYSTEKLFRNDFFIIRRTYEFDDCNHSSSINDIRWFHQNLPTNFIRQFSRIYIKRKQSDSIFLKYQYCLNQTCQILNHNQLDFFIIYAIPLHRKHEDYAHYLINRTDSCVPLSRLVYRLWIQLILKVTNRAQLFQIPYERRTFYQTLLEILSISNKSCLFYNGSNPLLINQTINQVSDDYLPFILHIIAYKNKFSFCDLDTFLFLQIEPIHNLQNSSRGFLFLITLVFFILFFILFIHLYTYYKNQQRRKYLQYHRLNQIDAGQFHQWHDIARYLNAHKDTENYYSIQNSLSNLPPTPSL